MAADSSPPKAIRAGALSALLEELVRVEPPPEKGWAEALRPGARVGRFELVREIGRGGFGVVFEARDLELGRVVALKAMRTSPRPEVAQERLLREAETAARLSHPNIVTLHDAGRTEDGSYLVLELLRGEPLARRLGRGPVPLREALGIATEVAKGLAHAHREGVVHRDLTPGNVFLCQGGAVKLLDLGLAHAFGRRKTEGGTPAYMAPEQWRGAPEDERTDVFALGVILFRMLTGELPFPDDGGRSVGGRGPAPQLEVPAAPALGALVAGMLAKDPAARVRDGAVLLEKLEAIAATLPGELPRAPPTVLRRPRGRPPARRPRVASVAVLPFADMSPGRDQEYFADGVAEEILNALAQVEGLKVAGRTSSFSFKGKGRTIAEIGRELGVGAVLEGSVRISGDRLRIAAQLVSVADGFELWSRTFDRDRADVFAVQDETARAVVEALRVKLLPGREPRGSSTGNREAYELFLLGRDLARTSELEQVARAQAALERAVSLDPGFAPAWAELAGALLVLEGLSGGAFSPERRQRSGEAAERAVSLGPDFPDGYVARSRVRFGLLDWAGALADVERALAIAPANTLAACQRGAVLAALGRLDEACAVLEQTTGIDPLAVNAWVHLGRARLSRGDHDPARRALARALEISPRMDLARYYLCVDLIASARPTEALAEAERAGWSWARATGQALAHHDLGHPHESGVALGALVAEHAGSASYQIAQVHAWRGEADLAFEWLARALGDRDPGIAWIKGDPLLSRLRADPRYAALLGRLGLPGG